MASSSMFVFLLFNVLFFTVATACGYRCSGSHHGHSYPTPVPSSGSSYGAKCPRDALKFGVCADVLNGLIHAKAGKPPKMPCCSLIDGLVDLEAAACLCTVIKANVLGLHINLPISLSLLLNYCGKNVPSGFQCAWWSIEPSTVSRELNWLFLQIGVGFVGSILAISLALGFVWNQINTYGVIEKN